MNTLSSRSTDIVASRARLSFVLLALAAGAIAYYAFAAMRFSLFEACRAIAGLAALYLPVGTVCHVLLREEIPSRLDRLTFSAVASYSLTTVAYFALCVVHAEPVFYIVQATLVTAGVCLWWRRARHGQSRQGRLQPRWEIPILHFDWILLLIVAASLIASARYSVYEEPLRSGAYTLTTGGDSTYFTSLAYELGRHVPPLQDATRAGLPERAYHMFAHMTAMLIGRYAGQPDLFRANFVYRYAYLNVLTCLTLFCVVRRITGSRAAGRIAASLMYVFAIPFPPLWPNPLGYFFFSLYPHATSFLEPVLMCSPQMYCSVPMIYALLLGILLLNRRVRSGRPVGTLPLLMALMAAAMLRFRVQVFMPLLPGFVLLMAVFWVRSRRTAFAAAAALAIVATALGLLEMRSPLYLANSARLRLGYNGLTNPPSWMNSWPYAQNVYAALSGVLGNGMTFKWAWQVLSLTMLAILNICGIPMAAAVVLFFASRKARGKLLPFTLSISWMLLGSLAGAMFIAMSYDSFSVGGQMILHTCIYGFPLLGVGIGQAGDQLRRMLPLAPMTWRLTGVVAIILGALVHQVLPRTALEKSIHTQFAVELTKAEAGALRYLHDQTPSASVVASPVLLNGYHAIYGGIGGRACYFEYMPSIVNVSRPGGATEDRRLVLAQLWRASSPEAFAKIISRTPITHLVEYARQAPLHVHDSSLMRKVWEDGEGDERVTIWQVLVPEKAPRR